MREFSDQKLRSTSRNRGLPPSQPAASKIASRIIGQSPAYEKLIFPNTFTAQAEAISGDRPSTKHGTTSITNQAVRSFGRLISESKLPQRAVTHAMMCCLSEMTNSSVAVYLGLTYTGDLILIQLRGSAVGPLR